MPKEPRYYKAYLSPLTTNLVNLRNPWVGVWWSAAFPGCGYILAGSYLKGFILVIWEFIININAHINLAIFYSFTGRFGKALTVLDKRWLLIYVPVYFYAMWAGYRLTIELNKISCLADNTETSSKSFKMNSFEINFLDKRNPWVASFWSLLSPGLGQLYCHRLIMGFFILVCWIVTVYFSRVLEAIHFAFIGHFAQSTAVVNPEWLMFIPSILGFAVYDAYINTVEYNKLFKREQTLFLQSNYQNKNFAMPGGKGGV